jgi:hypothetical protein
VGVSGWERVSASSATDNVAAKTMQVNCGAGKKVLGGGFQTTGTSTAAFTTYDSFPFDNDTWQATVTRDSTSATWTLIVWAICATVS